MALRHLSVLTGLIGLCAVLGALPAIRQPDAPVAYHYAPKEIRAMVEKMAPGFNLDPRLVLAVIAVESAWQVDAVSTANAQGLMQLIPATAERFGVRDAFDPADNLRGGMAYLQWLLDHFKGDVTLALAAYNAGEGAVRKYGGVPPYKETRRYVQKVRRLYTVETHPYGDRRFDNARIAAQ